MIQGAMHLASLLSSLEGRFLEEPVAAPASEEAGLHWAYWVVIAATAGVAMFWAIRRANARAERNYARDMALAIARGFADGDDVALLAQRIEGWILMGQGAPLDELVTIDLSATKQGPNKVLMEWSVRGSATNKLVSLRQERSWSEVPENLRREFIRSRKELIARRIYGS
jgi:hypothetical protein